MTSTSTSTDDSQVEGPPLTSLSRTRQSSETLSRTLSRPLPLGTCPRLPSTPSTPYQSSTSGLRTVSRVLSTPRVSQFLFTSRESAGGRRETSLYGAVVRWSAVVDHQERKEWSRKGRDWNGSRLRLDANFDIFHLDLTDPLDHPPSLIFAILLRLLSWPSRTRTHTSSARARDRANFTVVRVRSAKPNAINSRKNRAPPARAIFRDGKVCQPSLS